MKSRFETAEELSAYRERIWEQNTYQFAGFKFRWVTGQVWIGDTECPRLTGTESDVLHTLIKAWPLPLSTTDIAKNLSRPCDTAPEAMKTWILRIRHKLGAGAIENLYGWGYRFNPEALMNPSPVATPDPEETV